ncbi:MAG: lactonase family protein, partial [Bryobacteraceae bacterium]
MTIRWGWLTRVALASQLCLAGDSQTERLYIGTYTNTDAHSRGIYTVTFDSRTGRFDNLGLAAESGNPSFLARHPSRPFLYAVNELADGAATSFRINSKGALVPLGSSSTKGAAPCYLRVDRSGKWLFVANYQGGSIAVLPIRSDGTTGEARITQLSGSGPSPRQKGPHPHQVLELPDGTILVPDLGTDTIARYRFNVSDGELSPAKPSGIPLAPGTGPRHLVSSADGKFLYVLGELANNVTVLRSLDSGENWTTVQSTSLVAPDRGGKTSAA